MDWRELAEQSDSAVVVRDFDVVRWNSSTDQFVHDADTIATKKAAKSYGREGIVFFFSGDEVIGFCFLRYSILDEVMEHLKNLE